MRDGDAVVVSAGTYYNVIHTSKTDAARAVQALLSTQSPGMERCTRPGPRRRQQRRRNIVEADWPSACIPNGDFESKDDYNAIRTIYK